MNNFYCNLNHICNKNPMKLSKNNSVNNNYVLNL